ncbi:unnamed protein product, partial [Notodromas monacha]
MFLSSISEVDVGDYYCRAENTVDSVDAPARLEILEAPKFTRTPQSTEAKEKGDVELACGAAGHPTPTIQWFKNGEGFTESDYFQIVNGRNLKIFGLLPADSGVYQCFASNDAGNAQVSARLIVSSASSGNFDTVREEDEELEEVRRVDEAESLSPRNLRAGPVNVRFIALRWDPPERAREGDVVGYLVFYKEHGSNREREKNATKPEVLLHDLIPDQRYDIRVVAVGADSNPVGSPASIVTKTQPSVFDSGPAPELSGFGPPSVKPFNVRAVALDSTSVRVDWAPSSANGGRTEYFLSYMAEDAAEEKLATTFDPFFILRNLRPYTMYTVWVGIGGGNSRTAAEDVTVRTFSDVPSEAPQNFTAEAASSKSIVVRWEPPPEGTANGRITGYKLRYKEKGSNGVAKMVTTDA